MGWKKLWSVGGYGYSVAVMRHDSSPNLHLRWGRDQWLSLRHADLASAKRKARETSSALLAARGATGGAKVRLGELLESYTLTVTPTKSAAQRKEDARRVKLWLHVLGRAFDPLKLTSAMLRAFERERRAGLRVPGLKLKPAGSNAIRADLAFLKAVFRWASSMDAGPILPRNPMAGYKLPVEVNPHRPVIWYEDYRALVAAAGRVNRLHPLFLRLVESLGWRVSAICRLTVADFDPARAKGHPHGRLLKRAESDKMGVERWTIINADTRAALDEVLRLRKIVGDGWLFPAPKRPGKPWTRHYARSLLRKAWKDSKVDDARWAGHHAFRRSWVTARKHLPAKDVAEQGAWLSTRTLDIYQQPDADSLLRVAEEPRKLFRARDV